jgi:SAM-dependent methyltransferase
VPNQPLERWRNELLAWAIPDEIASRAEDPPWAVPHDVFVRRADRRRHAPTGPSYERAWEALEAPGSVLDVGAGAGAASLPLAPRATSLTAVDVERGLLDVLATSAAEVGLPAQIVEGRWPDVAAEVAKADVVTCHHVLYNVADLRPFVTELTAHARRRVVAEVTHRHPMTWLRPLWQHFHGLPRPAGPTAQELIAALDELGVASRYEEWQRPSEVEYSSFAAMVDMTRRRLCLPRSREEEVAEALRVHGLDGDGSTRKLVTIWWPA